MKKNLVGALDKQSASRPFLLVSVGAVILGGILSAFLASEPSQAAMWVSAFIVLVVGVSQFALGYVLTYLKSQPNASVAATVCALYNLACFTIIVGTVRREDVHYLVVFGSIILLVSLIAHTQLAKGLPKSLGRNLYYVVMFILVCSIAIGNYLSFY